MGLVQCRANRYLIDRGFYSTRENQVWSDNDLQIDTFSLTILQCSGSVTFLLWIWIRIVGSVHWMTDPDPALFVRGFRDGNKKFVFFILDFFIVCTFTTVFKDSKSLRSHKTVEIKVFLFFCFLMEGTESWRPINLRIRIRKQGGGDLKRFFYLLVRTKEPWHSKVI